MFVIINSTPTRSTRATDRPVRARVLAEPHRKFASRLVGSLYSEGDSPLRYASTAFGGRSAQDKWILQAELSTTAPLGEPRLAQDPACGGSRTQVPIYYGMVRDFSKRPSRVWGEAWGHPNYMVTRPVTLKAMLRVCSTSRARTAIPRGPASTLGRAACPWRDR